MPPLLIFLRLLLLLLLPILLSPVLFSAYETYLYYKSHVNVIFSVESSGISLHIVWGPPVIEDPHEKFSLLLRSVDHGSR